MNVWALVFLGSSLCRAGLGAEVSDVRDYGKVSSAWWTRGTGRQLRGDAAALAVALYLRTCPHGNLCGLFYLPQPTIAHETGVVGVELDRVLVRLDELAEAHFDAAADLVWVPDIAGDELGAKTLSPADNRRIALVKALSQVHAGHRFRVGFAARYAYLTGDEPPPPPKPLRTPSEAPPVPPPDPLGSPPGTPSGPHPEGPPTPLGSQEGDQDQDQDQNNPPACARGVEGDLFSLMLALDAEGKAAEGSGLAPSSAQRFGMNTAKHVAERGGRFTPTEQARLREILRERTKPAPTRRRQAARPTGRQGLGDFAPMGPVKAVG